MSFFSKIGKAIGGAVKGVGHVAGKVLSNPIVDTGLAFIPGVGPGAAALAAGAGRLMAPGGNIGNALKTGVKSYGIGKLAGVLPGADKIKGMLGGLPGAGAVGNIAQKLEGSPAGQAVQNSAEPGGFVGKLAGAAKGYFGSPDGGLDMGKILGAAGGAAALYGQHQANNNANAYMQNRMDLQNKMLGTADQDYQSRAGLRTAAYGKLSGMLTQPRASDVYRPFLQKEQNAAAGQ